MKTTFSKYTMAFLLALTYILTANLVHAQEQTADTLNTNAVQARGDTSDENIIVGVGENVKGEEVEAPPAKSSNVGERSRNRYVNFDNWTGLYIESYIDGYYQGTIAPWGSLRIHVPSGKTYKLYARAVFDDDSYVFWGSIDRYIGNSFEWRLHTE